MLFSRNHHEGERWGKRSHFLWKTDKPLSECEAGLRQRKAPKMLMCLGEWYHGSPISLPLVSRGCCIFCWGEREDEAESLSASTHTLSTHALEGPLPLLCESFCLLFSPWTQAPPSATLQQAWSLAHRKCSVNISDG